MTTTTTQKPKNLYPKCDWRYCRQNGTLFPILTMPAPKFTRQSVIEMELDLNVCNQHADEDKVEHFLDDKGWFEIQQYLAMRKLTIPDRSEVKVIFRALEDRLLTS
jgi:hypothetical protein